MIVYAVSATAQSIPHGNPTASKRQMSATTTTDSQTALPIVHDLDDEAIRKLIGRGGERPRPLMLYLWYTACEDCRTKLLDIQRIYDEYRERGLDVVIVSISPIDSKETLSQYLLNNKIRVPAYLLRELGDDLAEDIFKTDWEVTVPAVFFYDRAGKVICAETDIKNVSYDVLKSDAIKALGIKEH